MISKRNGVSLSLLGFLFLVPIGCGSNMEEPKPAKISLQVPLTETQIPIKRWIQVMGGIIPTHEKVFWLYNDKLVEPNKRIQELVNSIPDFLTKADRFREYFDSDENGSKEIGVRRIGVVISLNPDAIVITCRRVSYGYQGNAFEEWYKSYGNGLVGSTDRLTGVEGAPNEFDLRAGHQIPFRDGDLVWVVWLDQDETGVEELSLGSGAADLQVGDSRFEFIRSGSGSFDVSRFKGPEKGPKRGQHRMPRP